MSIIFRISPDSVNISKFQLEFPFQPPPRNISEAALGAYHILRQSVALQTEATRAEREEAISLLRKYGFSLFLSIVPEKLRATIAKEGTIFLQLFDWSVDQLPWELLYDGKAFCALTQGVVRIEDHAPAAIPPLNLETVRSSTLDISFQSADPPSWKEPILSSNCSSEISSRFIGLVEEIMLCSLSQSSKIRATVNGVATKHSIIEALNNRNHLLYFSGYDDRKAWIVEDTQSGIYDKLELELLRPHFETAIKRGLRGMILQTSALLSDNHATAINYLSTFFRFGLPMVIGIFGRLGRIRLKEYVRTFLFYLVQGNNLLSAHRQALNSMQSVLPLSWDWTWIQLRANLNCLRNEESNPLQSFHFSAERSLPCFQSWNRRSPILHHRRFNGDREILRKVLYKKYFEQPRKILSFYSPNQQPSEIYFHELIRRLSTEESASVAFLFYTPTGFAPDQKALLPESFFAKDLQPIYSQKNIKQYLDRILFHLTTQGKEHKFLLLHHPPLNKNPILDQWLEEKLENDWKIVVFTDHQDWTKLRQTTVTIEAFSEAQLYQNFEDQLLKEWWDVLDSGKQLPKALRRNSLIKIIQRMQDPVLIQLSLEEQSEKKLWQAVFQRLHKNIGKSALQFFTILYLCKTWLTHNFLKQVLQTEENDTDHLSRQLQWLHLIDSNLPETFLWVPLHLQHIVKNYELLPKEMILAMADQTLRTITELIDDKEKSKGLQHIDSLLFVGFLNCLHALVDIGEMKIAVRRTIQLGKKIAAMENFDQPVLLNLARSCMEIALFSGEEELMRDTLLACLDWVEVLGMNLMAIHIYEWLQESIKKIKDWDILSEIQMRQAHIYTTLGEKDKAVQLLTSTVALNADQKNFANKYHNMINIALLLLEMKEFDKVVYLVERANFDPKLINEKNTALLWLIDGHLLYYEQRWDEALNSLQKGLKSTKTELSPKLIGLTHEYLAEILLQKGDKVASCNVLEIAATYLEQAGDRDKSAEFHDRIGKELLNRQMINEAIPHLNWLFEFHKSKENIANAVNIADHLGQLYHKIGNPTKATELYMAARNLGGEQPE